MLKFQSEVKLLRFESKILGRFIRPIAIQQKRFPQKIESRRIRSRIQPLSPADRIRNERAIAVRILSAIIDIRAVHRKAGNRFANNRFKNVVGKVAGATVRGSQAAEQVGQHIHFACQRSQHHLQLRLINNLVGVTPFPGRLRVDFVERGFTLLLNKKFIHQEDEVITTGAAHGPLSRHVFMRLQNFFDHYVKWTAASHPVIAAQSVSDFNLDSVRSHWLNGSLARALAGHMEQLKPDQILSRVEHPVAMVDAQPRHLVFRQQPSYQAMCFDEDLGVFHSQSHQIVHIEEAPIVDFLCRYSPKRQPVRLSFQQRMQPVKTPRIVFNSVNLLETLRNELSNFRCLKSFLQARLQLRQLVAALRRERGIFRIMRRNMLQILEKVGGTLWVSSRPRDRR